MNTRCSLSLTVGLALLLASPASAQAPVVVVAGEPPLTEETIGRFTEFFEWAFDVHLTNEQSRVLRQYTVDAWTKKKASDQKDVLDLVQQQVDLAKLPANQRAAVRLELEPQLLASMRKQPKEPMARWALGLYEASHQPLAAGTPPLTRQSTDAFLEALFFMVGEVAGQQVVPDAKLKDDWAKGLAANYPKMPAELKQQIAGMPAFVTALRLRWPVMPESEKATLRTQWAEQVKALIPAPAAAKAPSAGKKSVAEMMAEQNRRHQSYMNMSDAMMSSYRISFNTQANFIGSSYRYW